MTDPSMQNLHTSTEASLRAVLAALVTAIESQLGVAAELDPTDDFVRALKDAKSWIEEEHG
jgi:hypothetical protein